MLSMKILCLLQATKPSDDESVPEEAEQPCLLLTDDAPSDWCHIQSFLSKVVQVRCIC